MMQRFLGLSKGNHVDRGMDGMDIASKSKTSKTEENKQVSIAKSEDVPGDMILDRGISAKNTHAERLLTELELHFGPDIRTVVGDVGFLIDMRRAILYASCSIPYGHLKLIIAENQHMRQQDPTLDDVTALTLNVQTVRPVVGNLQSKE